MEVLSRTHHYPSTQDNLFSSSSVVRLTPISGSAFGSTREAASRDRVHSDDL
jgi:hypothetical protein